MADKTYTVNGISLPPEVWEMIEEYSKDWRANRSATILRILLEWKKNQPTKTQESEPALIAA